MGKEKFLRDLFPSGSFYLGYTVIVQGDYLVFMQIGLDKVALYIHIMQDDAKNWLGAEIPDHVVYGISLPTATAAASTRG